MRQRLLFIPVLLLIASSCGKYTHPIVGGRNLANTPDGIQAGAVANATANPEVSDICDTEPLSLIRARAESLQDCDECQQDTVILVSEFYNEVDASYRMATTSCRAFSRCMQNNFYDEGQCRSTLASWERSREDFGDLSRELREIEAEVDRDRINRRGGWRRGVRLNPHECDCSQSVGGVFANCCDTDSDSQYSKNRRY